MRRRTLLIALPLAVIAGTGVCRWLTNATPVSKEAAVDAFRTEQQKQDAQLPREAVQPPEQSGTGTESAGRRDDPAVRSGGGSREESPTTTATPSGGAGDVPDAARPVRPARGVYTYDTTGGESISGYRFRKFPDRTFRTVVHTGAETWTDHHFFLEERQAWVAFLLRPDGRVVEWTRNKLVFGALTFDSTINFSPPMRSTIVPWEGGRRWEGSFEGKTYGTYKGTTIDHAVVGVGAVQVPTWIDQLEFELHGELEGRVLAKRWISPERGVTVREEYDADVKNGPVTYTAKWTVHLADLDPTS